jgi:hypothetical protein
MQTFALLSLEFQFARQRLRETFTESQVCAEARNLNLPSNVATSSTEHGGKQVSRTLNIDDISIPPRYMAAMTATTGSSATSLLNNGLELAINTDASRRRLRTEFKPDADADIECVDDLSAF